MANVFLNPGHAPNGNPDPGACGFDLRESDVAARIANLLMDYLTNAGVGVAGNFQSDSLGAITNVANNSGADLFISIHCNAVDNPAANGTETLIYARGGEAEKLAGCVQTQLVDALHTTDRGLKERPGLYVLAATDMPAILVEVAFITNPSDNTILRDKQDDIARAIARGVTDYLSNGTAQAPAASPASTGPYVAKYFSQEEMMCHGRGQGHCQCGAETATEVSPRLLELLDKLRENVGGPLEVSCMYRCPAHNAAVGGVDNSPHVKGVAADVQTPNYPHCNTPDQLKWYAEKLPFDGIGLYDWGVHVDVRDGGVSAGYRW